MIVLSRWVVPESEVEFRFTASGGPGGQHANRSNTKVEAVLHLDRSSMPHGLRERVIRALGPVVRVSVDDERSQHRNRQIALERLQARIDGAADVPRRRVATRPSGGSRRRRLESKRRRGDVKRGRRRPRLDD